jgi:quinol-cytochrome oxidoreductase complex cytochrome b subunit
VKRGLPIRPGHPLYPVVAAVALAGLLFGRARTAEANELSEAETHLYFPDHWWPYPIMATGALIVLGLLALVARPALEPTQAASPAASALPFPDWYFLFLHKLLELGPAAVTTILIPLAGVLVLLAWPLIDSLTGPGLARRLGWRSWPAPGRNPVTGTLWLVVLALIALLTLWGLLGPSFCVPWFYQGPVCG